MSIRHSVTRELGDPTAVLTEVETGQVGRVGVALVTVVRRVVEHATSWLAELPDTPSFETLTAPSTAPTALSSLDAVAAAAPAWPMLVDCAGTRDVRKISETPSDPPEKT